MNKRKNRVKIITFAVMMILLWAVGVIVKENTMTPEQKEFIDNIKAYNTASIIIPIVLILLSIFEAVMVAKSVEKIDPMTGIGNQDFITGKGGYLYYRKKLHKYTLIFMNIKDCKYINQKIGNSNADKAICQYAQLLQKELRKKGYIGRMGGDNFVVFVKNEYLDDFLTFLKKVSINIITDEEEINLKIGVRCGIVGVSYDVGYREILNRAAFALSKAKSMKNQDFVVFESSYQDEIIGRKELLVECKNAMMNEEFVVYYQPKIQTKDGFLCGAEALVRWNRDGKIFPPFFFIPALEEEDRIRELDFYVFEMVCRDIRGWLDRGINPVRVSSNFSKQHLKDDDFAERLFEIQDKYNVDSKYLEIELTESSGYEDFEALKSFISAVKERGLSVSIDDFGTGYSSLSLLREMKADVVKLDKSFLDSVDYNDEKSRNFIHDIIQMISNQDETILCEGVETEEQLKLLKDCNCDMIQGYFFDKPLPKGDYEIRLANPKYTVNIDN